jgi:hypothetical protein
MDKLIILLCIVVLFLVFKPSFEPFSQDFYPHQYASNIIPCSSSVKDLSSVKE